MTHSIYIFITVQYPVVAAGTALLAAAALGATSFAAPATVVGGVAAVGAGAGGMMLAETQCLSKYYLYIYLSIYLFIYFTRNNVLLFQVLSTADLLVDSAVNLS